jgi:nucleoside-diphosphate-sugar epimerase
MRIAVTGSAGRVGRAVVETALAAGHTVVEIDRADAPNANGTGNGTAPGNGADHNGGDRNGSDHDGADHDGRTRRVADVTDYAQLERAVDGCDALIHLAAHVRPGGAPDHVVHNDNVVGTYNALTVAVAAGIDRVCLASSINALGGAYSRRPRYDYFPLDERHPTYNEDPYGLSKWIGEAQADSIARRHERLSIASLRIHGVTPHRPAPRRLSSTVDIDARHLWGYVLLTEAARACLLALTAPVHGHEVFYVVAPETTSDTATAELCQRFYPEVPIRADLSGHRALFDCTKAESLLGWRHDRADTPADR